MRSQILMPLPITNPQSYEIDPKNAWDASLDPHQVFLEMPSDAINELQAFLEAQPDLERMQKITALESIEATGAMLPLFLKAVHSIEDRLLKGSRIVILRSSKGLTFRQRLALPWVLGQLMGTLLEQNESGERAYLVADRGKKMEQGARYSHTNQGGSFHTDGVNLKSGYDYFLLHCIAAAPTGGESVLLNGLSVLKAIQDRAPEILEELNKERVWEYKGIYKDKFYNEPILKIADNEPCWRYLRNYIEEAAEKTGSPLTSSAIHAMDQLDAVLDDLSLQFRYKLRPGETAIINDKQIFHGRTAFVDDVNAVSLEQYLQQKNSDQPIRRTYSRFWVNKAGTISAPE